MIKRLILIILISIALSGCGVIPEPPEPNLPTYRAFLVGVAQYENGWTLPSPADNTEKLAFLFLGFRFGEEEIPFTIIKPLVNLEATKENILNGIVSAFADADENDVSYFYYMGHGGLHDGIPVITPTDYHYGSPVLSAITVHELESTLSAVQGTKIVFLEACQSGNFIGKNKGILEPFKEHSLDLLNKENYQVLTSSKGSEPTWDAYWGSYFCRFLIEGCENLRADMNYDEIVDLSELYQYIKFYVTKQTVQIYPKYSIFPIVEY